MSSLSTRHLLGIKQLNETDIQSIFETAETFKTVINRPIKKVPSLRDITIANLFFENSTRTRVSFELAQKRLSVSLRQTTSYDFCCNFLKLAGSSSSRFCID